MPLTPGTRLDGYQILGPLGAGGMGEVYRARDSVLKREVAIKVLPAFVSQDPDRLRRFQQEAEAAAALNHPNILAVHQLGTFEGSPYLVSELLEGDTLRQLMQRGPLSVRKAIEYGVQIAHGLAAAHEKGIVHRDLKPENLFVTKDGRVKILDFGLAKLIRRQVESGETQGPPGSGDSGPTLTHQGTEPGMVVGTVGYMAPEQVRGKAADHRSDIFAFGAILYEMVVGKRAFEKATSAETMTAILNEDPPAISQIAATAPPGLQRVVHRCLEKNAEQRFQSASDLAFALEAISESGISGAVSGAPKSAPRKSRKALLWSACIVGILALGVGAYFLIGRANRSRSLRISEYTQITHDGHAGRTRGTDGSRVYVRRDTYSIGQVSTTGGEIVSVPVSLSNPVLLDVSQDGSTFLVASFTGGTTISHTIWSAPILGGSVRYLATGTDAGWSPDGSSAAYSTPGGDIRLVRSDGTGDRKLASVGGIAYLISWSPDGGAIRFTKGDNLWEMSADGSNLKKLLPKWNISSWKCCGKWSPDGTRFYFVSNGQIWAFDERHGLLRRSQAEPVQLTSGPLHWINPYASKDGKKIFASGATRQGELIRFDSKTKQFQPYLTGLSADNLAFSKNGKSMAYVSYPEGILWRADRDGSNRVQLSDAPMEPEMLDWSPDGTQILFVDATANGRPEIYVVSSQGGSPRRMFPDSTGPETDPHWSPDGRKIVFSPSPEGGADPKSDIRVFDVNGKRVTILPGSVGMFTPHWSPDGRLIAAVRMNSRTLNIFDIKTQRWSTPYTGIVAYPAWSKDGRSVYFLNFQDNPCVYRVGVADGVVERITDLKDVHYTGNFGMWMGVDPSDAPLLLRDIGTRDIYALTLEER